MARLPEIYCPIHPLTRMICPRCIGARGGKKTNKLHAEKLSKWGKRGSEEDERSEGDKEKEEQIAIT
jgi:hypothetical protein